jgi:magnesium chelatase subunit I
MREIPGLGEAVRKLTAGDGVEAAESPAVAASAVEFVLEGLHLQRRINKDRAARGGIYRR